MQEKYPKVNIITFTDLIRFVDVQNAIADEFGITKEEAGAHAGEFETSQILALNKNLVKKERFQVGYLGVLKEEEVEMLFERGMPSLTKIGVIGDPTKSSKKRGKIYIEKVVDFLTNEIRKKLKLVDSG